jgi:putative toxin-antitoxin system antitoxin component (TIGR02293 family)
MTHNGTPHGETVEGWSMARQALRKEADLVARVFARRGGPRGRRIHDRGGVPVALVDRLTSALAAESEGLALLGISERNVPRRASTGRLKPIESDRFYRIAKIVALTEEALGDPAKAREWLRRPNRALGGETPFDFLDTEAGAQEVENLLGQIQHGMFT